MALRQTENCSQAQIGPVGCQYVDNGGVCGEKGSLAIIDEMQKMYEEKMKILDKEGGGDYETLQAKNRLQGMWIKDLIEQSKMLISAIQELEHEATERVRLLEKRIKKNTNYGNEVMNKYRDLDIYFNVSQTFQNAIHLQSDLNNLVKLIKEYRENGIWSVKDVDFYFVKSDDLSFDCQNGIVNEPAMSYKDEKFTELMKQMDEKDLKIKNLEHTVSVFKSNMKVQHENEVEHFKKEMADMRSALTAEVAEKHEIILSLRRDIQQLEEQCRQAEKQMIFKDDIIKEMRKDIKQLKSECKNSDAAERKKLEEDICRYKGQQHNLNTMIENLKKETGECQKQKYNDKVMINMEECRRTYDTVLKEIVKKRKATCGAVPFKEEDGARQSPDTEEFELNGQIDPDTALTICQQLHTLKAEKEEVEKNYDTLKHCYEELRSQYEKVKNHECVIPLDEHEKLQKEILEKTRCEYEGKTEALKKEGECYKQKYEESLCEMERINREKEKREQKIKELGCAIKECEEYQKKYEKGLAEIERINIEKAEHERKIKELECSMKGYEECRIKYAASLREIDALQKMATRATYALQEEVKLVGKQGTYDVEKIKEERDCLKWKAMEAVKANNALEEQYCKNLEEKMKEICMLKQQIEKLEEKHSENELVEGKRRDIGTERCRKDKEIANLKDCIKELEGGHVNTKLATESLQSMISSYRKSNSILEESEKHLKLEVAQQKLTINNLQEALLNTKQELEELRQKATKEIYSRKKVINSLYRDLIETESNCLKSHKEAETFLTMLNNLKDAYLDLEVENFSYVQDIEILDSRLLKYQQVNKLDEKIANTSNLDLENQNLADDLIDAHAVNNVLQQQLKVAESQLAYEMKMNKHYIALIEELQDKLSSETVKGHRLEQKLTETQYQLDSANSVIKTLEDTVSDLENTIILYEKDITFLRQKEKQNEADIDAYKIQLQNLSAKMIELEENYKALEEELQEKVKMFMDNENKIKQDFEEREQKKVDVTQQLELAREELNNLKNELSKMANTQSKLRGENDKLKVQINLLHKERNEMEQQILQSNQQIEQYTIEIQSLQADREIIEDKYEKLKNQLQALQLAFDNLSKQFMNKTESLMSLEMELVDTKSSHTQLCNESKKVVENVRSWLEEQKEINRKLQLSIKNKEDIINELRNEIRKLRGNLTLPSRTNTNVEHPHNSVMPVAHNQSSIMKALNSSHPWSLGSQGSESSYSSSPIEGDDTMTSDVDTTDAWLYRVESMTQQLQRSNDYWKNRIHDYEYMVTRDQ